MRIAVAGDHAGLDLKNDVKGWLHEQGHEVVDLGAHSYDADDDYPDFADSLADVVASGHAERGVLLCGSGVGASVAANKAPGVRAGMCHDTYSAHQGVEHDGMNVLCLGARVIGVELARELLTAFLAARFSGEERHVRRLGKLQAIEARASSGQQRASPQPQGRS